MDNEMIERVARVLSPQSWEALNTPCDTKAKAKRREASLDYAQRCIKALREPTEKMLEAGSKIDTANLECDTWQAMIDAVINETPN